MPIPPSAPSPGALGATGRAIDLLHNATITTDYRNGVPYLIEKIRCLDGSVATVGFCTGATYSMLLAMEQPGLACAVMAYVSQCQYMDLSERKPFNPIDKAGSIRCSAMFVSGLADFMITQEVLARLEKNLNAGGVTYDLRVYPGASHAFMNPDLTLYHPEATR